MIKKITAVILVLALLLGACACSKTPSGNNSNTADPNAEEQQRFAAFVDKQYIYSIESDYTTAHIYYNDWEKAGLSRSNIEISFGTAPDDASMKEDREYYEGLKKELETFDRSKLTRRQQDEYDGLVWEIGCVLAMCDPKFDYYSQMFTPPNSLEANLASLFTSWDLRNEQDVKDVITLIDSIPAYVDSAIEYAKKQQEKNLLMTNFEDVIESCQDILDSGLDSYAIKCILDQVDEQELSQEQKDAYKKDILAALERSFLPYIKKIQEAFESIKGGNNITGSYSALPNGAEYYQAILNYKLGLLGVSAADIRKELINYMSVHYNGIVDIYRNEPNVANTYYSNNPKTTKYTDYTAILEDVKVKMLADHPEVKDLKYEILKADPEEKLDEKNVAAYFIIPPVDGDHLQRMRVNPSNKSIKSIDTYMTVTHEGFPGHMYQYAYAAEFIPSDYIKTLGVDAVVEGYAVYSQYHALEYLTFINKPYRNMVAYNEQYAYAVYSTVDIGINYEGWDVARVQEFFTDSGFNVGMDSAQEIYDLLRLNPAYYLPYSYGYEYIEALRTKAQKELGTKFEALDFNKAILDAGPSPLSVLDHYVDEYIENAKKASNTNTGK